MCLRSKTDEAHDFLMCSHFLKKTIKEHIKGSVHPNYKRFFTLPSCADSLGFMYQYFYIYKRSIKKLHLKDLIRKYVGFCYLSVLILECSRFQPFFACDPFEES